MQKRTLAVAAVAAVVLALASGGGGAVAAGKITGRDIKNSSVTGKDLKDGSVTGADVADAGLSGADLLDGSVTEADVAPGGLSGASVKDGSISASDLAPGAAGLRGLQRVSLERAVTASADFYGSTFATVPCPTGKVVVSGGYVIPSSSFDVSVFRNAPTADLTGWEVAVRAGSGSPFIATFYALCATA
ncbi:hypothetical protein [Nocardioides flavescens]|uniref:Pentapeptide repeat-containing protein n=1 Tax=Nocardioides flavescens TaxID=2691959 RepID=A0A6L7EUQ6_9ACTN|nr:hypothetical protein [Nocardioides flavescens]MXG89188.1 hypothetical protein [Nocardioides flavescens]